MANASGTSSLRFESETFSVSTKSMRLASSAARAAAWAGVLLAAPASSESVLALTSRQRCTSCMSVSVRSKGETAGGRSSAPVPSVVRPASPDSRVSSSSPSEMGRMRGISSDRAPDAARNASCNARAARRVGSNKVTSCRLRTSSFGPPATGRSPLKSARVKLERKPSPGGTV